MVSRRDIVKTGLGLAGILTTGKAPAFVKSILAATNTSFGTKAIPSAREYIQDGLVGLWDGIENASFGVHDQTATVWTDLISGVNAEPSANNYWHVTNNAYVIEKPVLKPAFIIPDTFGDKYLNSQDYSIECVIRPTQNMPGSRFFGNRANGKGTLLSCGTNNNNILLYTAYYGRDVNTSYTMKVGEFYAITVTSAANMTSLYVNDIIVGSASWTYNPNGGRWGIGGTFDLPATAGNYHCFRVYNRPLTADEVYQNHELDSTRFL